VIFQAPEEIVWAGLCNEINGDGKAGYVHLMATGICEFVVDVVIGVS